MIRELALVGLGGAAGSILRYLASSIAARWQLQQFPVGTFFVNITGCLLTGVLFGYLSSTGIAHQHIRLLFIIGFCGGFTTFSAFALENMLLMEQHNTTAAILYILVSIIAGLGAVWLGLALSR